jgi:uncharacterized membrane protein
MNQEQNSSRPQSGAESFPRRIENSRRVIGSLKAKADKKRRVSEKLADWMTGAFGSMNFLFVNVVWFAVWIVINLGLIPGITPFDPFPFGLLTMIVSLEAIILAITVLISQNREEKVGDVRQEIDLQLDIIAEDELTKLLQMVSLLLEKNGIDVSGDEVLQSMLQPTSVDKIEEAIEQEVMHQH